MTTHCPECGGFLSMQRLWNQTGTETVEERWIPRQCQKCNPTPEYSEEAKSLIAEAVEENRRRDIEEMKQLFSGLRGKND